MNTFSSVITFSLIFIFSLSDRVYSEELLTISTIVKSLKKSTEYHIQEEDIIQADYIQEGIDGMLDGHLSTEIFKYTSENYPNPPITLDSNKEGYGISIDYNKMTSFGLKYSMGIGFEDRDFSTIPRNGQFSLDAMDSVYKASIAVPLFRNFGSREYHYKKSAASKKKDGQNYKSKYEKDQLVSEAVSIYWTIVKLVKEKGIAEKSLKRFKSLHKLNLVKKRSGIISKAEILTSDVEVTYREKNVNDIISKISVEYIKLKALLEEESLPILSMQNMLISKTLLQMSKDEISKYIQSGLALSQLNKSKELLDSLVKIEEEATKSNVDLFVSAKSFGRGSDISESIDENSQDKFEIYAGISWSFDVNSKKNSSNLGSVLSKKRQAVLRKKQTSLKLRNRVDEIREKIKSNLGKISYLEKIKNQQRKILKAEKKRFKNGKISTLDYVKLQESYDRSSLQIIALNYYNEIVGLKIFSSIGQIELYLDNYVKKDLI